MLVGYTFIDSHQSYIFFKQILTYILNFLQLFAYFSVCFNKTAEMANIKNTVMVTGGRKDTDR